MAGRFPHGLQGRAGLRGPRPRVHGRIGTHVLYLGGSKPVFRKATFSQFVELQEELEEQREREAQRLNAEIERKMDFVRRFGAKATKARQAGSRQKMAKKLEKELEGFRPEAKRKELSFKWPEPPKADKTILSVADLAFAFPDGVSLWPPLTFTIYRGQRIALVGHNGLRQVDAAQNPRGPSGAQGRDAGHGLAGQDGLLQPAPDGAPEQLGHGARRNPAAFRSPDDGRGAHERPGLFLLGQNYFDRQVSSLSGGERSRLVLASFSARQLPCVDEPTNHLDLESREALVEALNAFDGTLLMVAHDRYLLSEVADEAWSMDGDGITVAGEAVRRIRRRAALAASKAGKESGEGTPGEG